MAALLGAARKTGTTVVHLQNTALPDRMSDSPAQIRFNLRMHKDARRNQPPLRYTIPGTPGHEFAPEFTPLENELVVRKYRSSGFWGTNLDMLLRSNGIKTVVVGGCTTEGCVESTARDAMFNDFYVVIAEDCVASDDKAQHDASMLLMRHRFDMAAGDEIQRIWRGASQARARSTDEPAERSNCGGYRCRLGNRQRDSHRLRARRAPTSSSPTEWPKNMPPRSSPASASTAAKPCSSRPM